MTYEVWFLIGAALVFWMQAGFAMVETGFTRAKNAGNIIMKNLMDFCIGTVVFSLIGYTIMMGEDTLFGLIGMPNMDMWANFKDFIADPGNGDFTGASYFVFNLVFCATTATIVSGAMAERTKFSAYCIYSAVISAVVYPIEAHWIWGGGWLSQIGFHDCRFMRDPYGRRYCCMCRRCFPWTPYRKICSRQGNRKGYKG